MRPKWQNQGALTAWLGGQDRAVVGPPALGMGDSYERAESLGRRGSGASGWGRTQAGQQYPQFRGHGSGPPICCAGKAPGNWGRQWNWRWQLYPVQLRRMEFLLPGRSYWPLAHLICGQPAPMGDPWNQECSASLLCPLHPGWNPEVAAEGQG